MFSHPINNRTEANTASLAVAARLPIEHPAMLLGLPQAREVVFIADSAHADIRMDLGEDWVFGAWLAIELIWSKRSYEMLGSEVEEGRGGLTDQPDDPKSSAGCFCGPT